MASLLCTVGPPRGRALLAVVAVLVPVASGAGAQPATPLPPLAGDLSSEVLAINPRGEVVGTSRGGVSLDRLTLVVWDRSGTPIALHALPPLAGELESRALAVNRHGEAAGASSELFRLTAVVWDRSGTPTALPPLAGDFASQAFAINRRGEVAGASFQVMMSSA
jgi:uncharacterized membrane protein